MSHHFLKAKDCFSWESWAYYSWHPWTDEQGTKRTLLRWLWTNLRNNWRGLRCFLRGKHLWHQDEGWATPDTGGEEWHCVCCGKTSRCIYY